MQTTWFLLSAVSVFLLSYVIGSTPWGFLIGKFNGLDIRYHGSGNIGATNVRRVLGRDWGVLCFALDFLKGLLPVLLIGRNLGGDLAIGAANGALLAAAATVIGHIWPFWLNFRGGKGMATTVGAIIAVVPLPVCLSLLGWLLLFFLTRYVSLASVGAAVLLPVTFVLVALLRQEPPWTPTLVLLLVLAAIILVRHRSNMQRLLQGTEYRFERKKRTP